MEAWIISPEPLRESRKMMLQSRFDTDMKLSKVGKGGGVFIPILNQMYVGKSGRWVVAIGQLELLQSGKIGKSFKAIREVVGKGLSGESLTELRRTALLAVRDDLEHQMVEASVTGTLNAH